MAAGDQPGPDWTTALRLQPTRPAAGRAADGRGRKYEIVCCDCGDDPALAYREVSPELQRIRGPYPIDAGITAYLRHMRRHSAR